LQAYSVLLADICRACVCIDAGFLLGVLTVCKNPASISHLLAADGTHCCDGNSLSETLSSYGVLPLSHGIFSTKFLYTVKKTVDIVILRLFLFELFHNMFILLPIKAHGMNKNEQKLKLI
jgi:hypothetical protein